MDTTTSSIVALTAALSAISAETKAKCDGDIQCSKCGKLTFRHDTVGESAAIINCMCRLYHVNDASTKRRIADAIRCIYSEQRSAYVHGALMRHEEYHRGIGMPSAVPDESMLIRKTFIYQLDFHSLDRIARTMLLLWLAEKSRMPLDKTLFAIDTDKVLLSKQLSFHVSMPARVLVGFPNPMAQLSGEKL